MLTTKTITNLGLTICLFTTLALPLHARAQKQAEEQAGAQIGVQGDAQTQPPLAIPRLTRVEQETAAITLDGVLNEAVWQTIPMFDGMRVISPDTLAETSFNTDIRIFYTERGIYIGVINHQPPGTLVARMTSRDVRLARDGFVVAIDPSGEGLYGFFLRINLGDSQTDGTILPERQLNMQWDGSWTGRTQALEDGWSVEYFVPWSMMPLPQADSIRQMGFYFERQVGHLGGEAWANPPLPRTVNQYISAFNQYELRDIEPRTQLIYYPFASTLFNGIKHEAEFKVGSELFWRPTTNTQLSATLNPDFGIVESDDVVVNLTAFETFFPEKRSFFLEGQDIFNTSPRASGRGGPGGPIRLLNTRRIGGAPDFDIPDDVDTVATDVSRPTELLGAVKFVGQAGNWRYGTMLASEDDTTINGTDSMNKQVTISAEGRDFAIARLLYEDTSEGGRRSIGWMGTEVIHSAIDATVNAVDMHYFSADSRWVIDGQLMHSDVDGVSGSGFLADVGFRPRRGINHMLRATYIDDKFELNNLGFLTRNDQMNLDYNYFRTESDIANLSERSTSIWITNQWNTAGRPVRVGVFFNREYTFMNNDWFSYSLRYFPSRIDDRLGGGSGLFRIAERFGINLGYGSDPAKPFAFEFELQSDPNEIGPARYRSFAGMAWRPNDRFSLAMILNYADQEALLVHLGGGQYTSYESHQWSPQLEANYFITAKQQLRFTMQWTALKAFEDRFWQVNTDKVSNLQPAATAHSSSADFIISRLTFQARYRWEIAPLSDLFVVYTRGSNLPRNTLTTFQNLFEQSWNDRIVDGVAIKLRYRLGS
ncbi:MAG: DUF5916 domain-containing protein [Pseudohongiellaceae bacterium]